MKSSRNKKKVVAFIPARSGSERIKNKNIRKLNGKPLISYSIKLAKDSKMFDKIYVLTDSKIYSKIAKSYGAEVPFLRKKKNSLSSSPDYFWLKEVNEYLDKKKMSFDYFFILRPTNPFRKISSLKKALKKIVSYNADSLRSVEAATKHPYKMWVLKKNYLKPFLKLPNFFGQPAYNSQTKIFNKVYVQNAALEISKFSVIKKYKTITGNKIIPYKLSSIEAFDINNEIDFKIAEYLSKKKF
jgi:CMP-N,N'-diacetyllegionaminic acid synthase